MDAEILEGFQEEVGGLMEELIPVVDQLETTQGEFPTQLLEEFAQKIDRIMGTANTLATMEPENKGFEVLGKVCGLCKATGYKAASSNHPPLIPLFAAFWADTIEVIEDITKNIGDPEKVEKILGSFTPVLQKRLEWLAQKVVEVSKATGNEQMDQIKVDALLESLMG